MALREMGETSLEPRLEPVISLCHTTARLPLGWKPAAEAWFKLADHPERIQYILGVDVGRVNEEELKHWDEHFPAFGEVQIAVNCGRRCAVDGWNATARPARGKLLITVSDDLTPCAHWDTELIRTIEEAKGSLNAEAVVDVSTGGNENLLTFSILTRSYFDRLTRDYEYDGGFFYHGSATEEGYFGMYGDNDFDAFAKRDGVVISAKRLKFIHDHPLYKAHGQQQMDEVHKHQHRPEAWRTGQRVFMKRMNKYGFQTQFPKPVIAVCLPGQSFSSTWVHAWTELYSHLMSNFQVIPIFGYSTNVYNVRQSIADMILKDIFPEPEFVLWIDDDNILRKPGFETLLKDLDHPEVDMVAGWCVLNHRDIKRDDSVELVSAGMCDSENKARLLPKSEFLSGDSPLVEVGYTGFPAVLMRYETLKAVGSDGFMPLLGSQFPWGYAGEDLAFSIRARAAGKRIFVDKRVRVPHLKLTPDFQFDQLRESYEARLHEVAEVQEVA